MNIDREVTKEEALYAAEEVNAGNDRGNSGQGSWETSSKVLFISIGTSNGQYVIDEECHWYTTPNTKSYDIIAARWSGSSFSPSTAYGVQEYWDNSSVNYSYLGNNMVSQSKGLGISMNLVDSGSDYKLYLFIKGYQHPGTTYGTYQHATSNISLSHSKSYTFVTNPNNGLGGVLNHSYASTYDNMQGVMVY